MKKFRAESKKQGNAALRERINTGSPPKRATSDKLGLDKVEMALMRLQMTEKCHILQPEDPTETIRWLVELTKDIGARRTRCVRSLSLLPDQAFNYLTHRLIEKSHNERLGIDGRPPKIKYIRNDLQAGYRALLSSLHRVDEGTAKSISKKYPTLRALYEAFESQPTPKQKEEMLVGIPVRDGCCSVEFLRSIPHRRSRTPTGRRIGS